jgi:hypothetical protein
MGNLSAMIRENHISQTMGVFRLIEHDNMLYLKKAKWIGFVCGVCVCVCVCVFLGIEPGPHIC